MQSLKILPQAEVNWHSTRIQEAQLHLPPRDHSVSLCAPYHQAYKNYARQPNLDSNTSEEKNTPHDDDEINHGDRYERERSYYKSAGQKQSFFCPVEKCRKDYPRISRLAAHFGQHVRCFEICVYCRERASDASSFLEHECKHQDDTAKEYYMRERKLQLRQYVGDLLNQMDPTLPRPQNRKRSQAMDDMCSVMRLEKKPRTDKGGNDKTQAPREIQPPMQTTIDSLQVNAGAVLPTPASSTWFDASDADYAVDSSSLLSSRKIAPVFQGVTITPSYYPEQQMSRPPPAPTIAEVDGDCSAANAFSSDTSANYSTQQLEQYLSDPTVNDFSNDVLCTAEAAVRMVAPMFRTVTITPPYNINQESQFAQTSPRPIMPTVTELLRMPHSGATLCQNETTLAVGAAQAPEAQFY